MYICVSTLKKAVVGEPLTLEKDFEFSELAVRCIDGGIIGFAMHNQPEGCLSFLDALNNIGGKKIMARVVMAARDAAVLYSESTVLYERGSKTSIIYEDMGICTPAIINNR